MRVGLLLLVAALPVIAAGQTIYPASPDWTSTDTQVSTGAALVDLDRDGWLDLVVANGNDMARQHVVVYYNQGDGTFPPTPNWQSSDIGYHGHVDIADVNGDGWLDVAVALLLNEGGPAAKLYLNNNGTLSALPDWTCTEHVRAFGVAFGDVNNDGRPDLAVATGWPYEPGYTARSTVHLNVGGELAAAPSWQSADMDDLMGVLWIDTDRDGWLDLVGLSALTPIGRYRNLGGTLAATADWHTTDVTSPYVLLGADGDLTGDGLRDLIVADNAQLGGGSGRFRLYPGLAGGDFATTASWTYYDSLCSAVALADLDGDHGLDLVTGGWWSHTRIFLNTGTGLPASATWSSTTSSVVEKLALGDVDKDGLRSVVETFSDAVPGGRLFYLAQQPVQEIVRVQRDGVELTPDQYTFSREHGWVTVGPAAGDVVVEYTCSSRLDLAVTNWDDYVGNFLYRHRLVHAGDLNCDGAVDNFDIGPFILLLTNRPAYDARWPDCDADTNGDMNGDGAIDNFDITGFVQALLD
ncbi:MAG: FG-GAP-like repeat-containing protein [Phycisphaerae bacterium]|jgi:hypothetical protein